MRAGLAVAILGTALCLAVPPGLGLSSAIAGAPARPPAPGPAAGPLVGALAPSDSWVADPLSVCATQHPAMVYPLRPHELATNLYCSFSAGRPLPPTGVPTSAAHPKGGAGPPQFGMYNLQLAYDAYDGYLVLFGATGSGPLNGTETWTFSNGSWAQLHPATSPESCLGSAMTYDPWDHYLVYLGGGNLTKSAHCLSAGQTWTFSGGTWTRRYPSLSPPPRQAAAFTNDSADGYLLLFGGACSVGVGGMCGDTWTFRGGNWTNRTAPGGPSPRAGAGMTFDASDGYVLMFGGITWPLTRNGVTFPLMVADTWRYRAGVWKQIGDCGGVNQSLCPSNQPPEPWPDGMTYDAADGVVLYTCSQENETSGYENYYTFHAGVWTNLNEIAFPRSRPDPANRLAEGLAYDWRDGYAVLFGGISAGWSLLNDTWAFRADRWTDISGGLPTGPGRTVFEEVGLPRGTSWNVTFGTSAATTTGTSVSFRTAQGTFGYVVGAEPGFRAVLSGTVVVDGLRQIVVVEFRAVTYLVTFTQHGLAKGARWQVTFAGRTISTTASSLEFRAPNGSYAFAVLASGYTATPASGSVAVAGARAAVSVTFT